MMLPFNHRIVTASAPRVATCNTADHKPTAFQRPQLINRLDGKMRTSGVITTPWSQQRRRY